MTWNCWGSLIRQMFEMVSLMFEAKTCKRYLPNFLGTQSRPKVNFFICTTKYSGNEAKRDVLRNTRGLHQSNKAKNGENSSRSKTRSVWSPPHSSDDQPERKTPTVPSVCVHPFTPAPLSWLASPHPKSVFNAGIWMPESDVGPSSKLLLVFCWHFILPFVFLKFLLEFSVCLRIFTGSICTMHL